MVVAVMFLLVPVLRVHDCAHADPPIAERPLTTKKAAGKLIGRTFISTESMLQRLSIIMAA